MFSFKRSLIALVGVLVIVGTFATLMPLVIRGQGGGNPFNRDTRKSFYVTQSTHNGSEALTACAEGYHMASLWEIFDTSNLRYNTELGATAQDSGLGPPSISGLSEGWIRTGWSASNSETVGFGNCNAWTSASVDDSGTVVHLDFSWDSTGVRISPWNAFTTVCSAGPRVWCMQD